MKCFSLTLCLLAVLGAQTSAQITENWEAQTEYNSALFDAGLRLTPSGLIAVHFEQLMEGRQKASVGIQQQFKETSRLEFIPTRQIRM